MFDKNMPDTLLGVPVVYVESGALWDDVAMVHQPDVNERPTMHIDTLGLLNGDWYYLVRSEFSVELCSTTLDSWLSEMGQGEGVIYYLLKLGAISMENDRICFYSKGYGTMIIPSSEFKDASDGD